MPRNLSILDTKATLHRKSAFTCNSAFVLHMHCLIKLQHPHDVGTVLAIQCIRDCRLEIRWPEFKSKHGYFLATRQQQLFHTFQAALRMKLLCCPDPWARAQHLAPKGNATVTEWLTQSRSSVWPERPGLFPPHLAGSYRFLTKMQLFFLQVQLKILLTGSPLSTVFSCKTICQLLPWQFHLLRFKLILLVKGKEGGGPTSILQSTVSLI